MLSIFDRFSFWVEIFIYTVFNNFFEEQNIQIKISNDLYHAESINGIKIGPGGLHASSGVAFTSFSWPLLIHTLAPLSFLFSIYLLIVNQKMSWTYFWDNTPR